MVARVVIVGGGIVGSMHAWMAARRGYEVVQLEREAEARGASVRNFGLVWVSGRAAGPELELALRARELWEDIGAEVPAVGFRAAGSVTVAESAAQAAVLVSAANAPDADARGFRLLDPAATRAINPALRGEFPAALYCARDAVVEPRTATRALRAALATRGSYRFIPDTTVTEFATGGVVTANGQRWAADLVILATGAASGGLASAHLASAGLRRCRLQMMQTAPYHRVLTTAVADGDSLRYYPAFRPHGAAGLPPAATVPARHRLQLLMVQRLDGSLTVGDTHAYDEPFDFDLDEEPYLHLRDAAQRLLGEPLPPVTRRWAGVYSELAPGPGPAAAAHRPDRVYHRAEVAAGVVLVTGPGGRGMTCSPAIAEETFREFQP